MTSVPILAVIGCCFFLACHAQDLGITTGNLPRVCASCIQGKTCEDPHPCKSRAGATCKFHTCTGSATTDKGVKLEFPLCKPTYYNADNKIITECLEQMDNPGTVGTGSSARAPAGDVFNGSYTTPPSSTLPDREPIAVDDTDPISGSGVSLVVDSSGNISAAVNGTASIDAEPGSGDPNVAGVVVCKGVDEPVCGSNGRTYRNGCEAVANKVETYTGGACKDSSSMCTMEYSPVCGSDNRTYSNGCVAKAEGVTSFRSGPCDPKDDVILPADAPEGPMPLIMDEANGTVGVPVVGDASSGAGQNELVDVPDLLVKEEKGAAANCTKSNKPVCGSDNVTYANSCVAKTYNITAFVAGSCNVTVTDMIDAPAEAQAASSDRSVPRSLTPGNETACTMEYAPVCGPNNVTYGNSCTAGLAGVKTYTRGVCSARRDNGGAAVGLSTVAALMCTLLALLAPILR